MKWIATPAVVSSGPDEGLKQELQQSQETAVQHEARVVQLLQERSLQLPPDQLARVDDMCPATVSREDLIEFMAAPPNDFWAGYSMACYVMRTQLAAVTGREFF